MKVLFIVQGPLTWLDEGVTVGHYDVHDLHRRRRAHYAANIGADYVDTLLPYSGITAAGRV